MTLVDLCVDAASGKVLSHDVLTHRLYERAKVEQWAIDRDIDWGHIELTGLPSAIQKSLSSIYTHVQAGEVLALAMTARAVDAAPELWAKMFGATQLMDEARHVEFFSRVVAKLGEPAALSRAMLQLVEELAELRSVDEILLGTQIVLEGYAQCLFLEGARLGSLTAQRRIRLPGKADPGALLAAVSDYVGRDESRHVAFGVLYLKNRWLDLDPRERDRLQGQARRFAALLEGVMGETQGDLARVGIDTAVLLERVRRTQATHFERIGLDK